MQGMGSWIVFVFRMGLWTLLVLQPATAVLVVPPGSGTAMAQVAQEAAVDPLYFARWNINYGEYLIDVGKYLEALEAFQTAIEATTNLQVQAEAHLQRASTLAIFLDAIDDAISEYRLILQTGPQHPLAETARFRLGMLFFDQQRHREAAEQFTEYLRHYPQGRFAQSADVLLSMSRRAPTESSPAPVETKPPPAESSPAPVETKPPPTESRPAPVETKPPPAESSPAPVETKQPPTERPTAPVERQPAPAEDRPSSAAGQPPPPTSASDQPVETAPPSSVPAITRLPVRVRLLKGAKRVVIRGSSALAVTTVAGQAVSQGQQEVILEPGRGGIVVGKRPSHARELRIAAAEPLSLVSKPIRCFRRDKEAPGVYRGVLRVFLYEGQLRVVNDVDIEQYLYGVVPAEVPSSWPSEALKALTIAARTYALYQAKHRQDWTYDLVDSDGDQVYRGQRCETARTNRAVDATRGMLLLHGPRPILAMYTSNTGWHSDSAYHVFDTTLPYLIGVEDPYSPTQPMGRWKRTHHAEEIQQKLRRIGLRIGAIQDIVPQAVTPSGRITHVKFVLSHGTKVLRARSTLRRALDLPEVLLHITRRQQTYVFAGGGFGHGVGLSQWGAKDMASKGKSAQDILHFYYQDVRVETLW